MDSSMSLAIAENLKALEQTANRCREDVSKSTLMASRYRSILAKFLAYLDGDEPLELRLLDAVEVEKFSRLADLEDSLVASGLQFLARIADRRQRILSRLEEAQS
jgi:hypothetical protein